MTPELKNAIEHMDWLQPALNGTMPCFHICDDGRFCGRAEKWAGHVSDFRIHKFVSLIELLLNFRKESEDRCDSLAVKLKSFEEIGKVTGMSASDMVSELTRQRDDLKALLFKIHQQLECPARNTTRGHAFREGVLISGDVRKEVSDLFPSNT